MLIEMDSLNRISPGRYTRRLRVFGSPLADYRALVFSYTRVGETSACAYDLVVRASTGEVYARDYELRTDGHWRDSDGNVANSPAALLPDEVRKLELERVIDLEAIEVTA